MGAVASTAVRLTFPLAGLVDQLFIILSPEERSNILDGLDELARRALFSPVAHSNRLRMVDLNTTELCLETLKLFFRDEIMVRTAVRILSRLTKEAEGAMRLVDLKGEDAIQEVLDRFGNDDDTMAVCQRTLKNMNEQGAIVATRDMRRALRMFMLRDEFKNAEANFTEEDRRRLKESFEERPTLTPPPMFVEEKDPGFMSEEKMISVVRKHMTTFEKNITVQNAALEVVLLMSKLGGDVPMYILNGDLCQGVVGAMLTFPRNRTIMWKGCMCVHIVHDILELQSEYGNAGAIKAISKLFKAFQMDRDLQAQGIWALAALAQIPNNIERMQASTTIMQIMYDVLFQDRPGKLDEDDDEDRARVSADLHIPLALKRHINEEVLAAKGKHRRKKKIEVPEKENPRPPKKRTPFGRAGDDHVAGERGLVDLSKVDVD
uniref:Uncharacterized protein n=1 Tax=Phaeomonas parva TaxID=124430 RepID=A0A7S1XZG2_9STRA|mmetsp:Transcript_46837/g.146158  ORF Transcript_46837/g.146158 Transcript_46837/m.146158 type:complete len:434 (+) Transcript_46837:97-1398(+)